MLKAVNLIESKILEQHKEQPQNVTENTDDEFQSPPKVSVLILNVLISGIYFIWL